MSKLLADEKVAALVTKETAKASKAETKRVLEVLKSHKDESKTIENKQVKQAVAEMLKRIEAAIKAKETTTA